MLQKRVLIISHPEDLHARAVAWAIREKGHTCVEFSCADLPTLATVTLTVGARREGLRPLVRHTWDGFDFGEEPFDTIWLRRRLSPWLPPSMHVGDREVARRQCDRILSDLVVALDSDAVFWVNHFDVEPTATLKVHQLRVARRAGLRIPETLVSNDPEEIRRFIQGLGGVAAHKLLEHAAWRSGDGEKVFVCYTSPVRVEDLPSDATLRLAPSIFQPLIEKDFEVRVACFGDDLTAVRIDSQTDDRAHADWRAGQWYIPMRPHVIPADVASGIRRFLRGTGLVCASLDFIVSPAGEYVFLEANPQGQFLWMEDRTGVPVLDICSDFLIAGKREFQAEAGERRVTWKRFNQLWESGLKDEIYMGVRERETTTVPE